MTHSPQWVCLMYHEVLPFAKPAGGGPKRFAVSLASFELMLDAIADEGYQGCSLGAALDRRHTRRVAITFDDGTISQFEYAVPALRARDMTATFFVTTDWIDQPGFMTWDQLRRLVGWGMSVQSHTKSHPFLSELDERELMNELVSSRTELNTRLDQETTEVSLPGGDAPKWALRHLFGEAGYSWVASSRWGRNADAPPSADGSGAWIRRCTVPDAVERTQAHRILCGDRRLALTRYARQAVLNGVRSVMGASRYARYRRRLLDAF